MKEKLAVFDIDGTLFRNSLLIELHWQLIKEGLFPKEVKEKVDQYYWAWVNREGHYDDYLAKVIETFKDNIAGIGQKKMAQLANEVIERQSKIVYRYTRGLIDEIRKDHFLLAISGSPEVMVEQFAKHWDFDQAIGTNYEVKDEKYTGQVAFVASSDKKSVLEKFMKENSFSKGGSLAVGDTDSDAGMFELVEKPICFNPNQKLYNIAKEKDWQIVVERKDVIYEI